MAHDPNIPTHVSIIMDGNGRWASRQGKERMEGHLHGVESVKRAISGAMKHGVRYLTLYVFSAENWGRPREEVDALMELLCRSVEGEKDELAKNGVRVRILGDETGMPEKVRGSIRKIEEETAAGDNLTVLLALNYSSREEIARAARLLARDAAAGALSPEEIDTQTFAGRLYTAEIPDPDLVIRTGGDHRLSNFLLWQSAYAELWFTELFWPDFTEETLAQAIADYGRRERRFGLVGK